ncbi:hypothetical protein ACFUIZ_27595 [Streptomyces cinereoruber]|uniref:hypothetical protein n=1 Tax=Streptomyces cinereoruber TaxID=67260 RepID=UPI0036365A9E
MRGDFQVSIQRYGPTVHLTPMGELDWDTGPALDDVSAALGDGVAVVVCGMRRLSFVDVTGVHRLLDLTHLIESRSIAFYAYNWQHQPQRLLDLIDGLEQCRGRGRGTHVAPTRPLRRVPRAIA